MVLELLGNYWIKLKHLYLSSYKSYLTKTPCIVNKKHIKTSKNYNKLTNLKATKTRGNAATDILHLQMGVRNRSCPWDEKSVNKSC